MDPDSDMDFSSSSHSPVPQADSGFPRDLSLILCVGSDAPHLQVWISVFSFAVLASQDSYTEWLHM